MGEYFDKDTNQIRRGVQAPSGFKKSVSAEQIETAKASAKQGGGMFQTLIRNASNAAATTVGVGETWSPNVNWMYGAGGKKLPKLPKGTKINGLVMGDYGLYSARIRAHQESLLAQGEAGVPMYLRGRFDKWLARGIWWVIVPVMLATTGYCMSTVVLNKNPKTLYNEYFGKKDK